MVREPQKSSSDRRGGSWLRLLPLAGLWAAPVVAVLVAIPIADTREAASVTAPVPSVVTVGSQSTDQRTSVSVAIDVEQPGQVRSSATGLLTAVSEAGVMPATGQELFAVDGVPVFAQLGTLPLHRELREGDDGADVGVLARFLVDAGLLQDGFADNAFGPNTRAAVLQLQRRMGEPLDGTFRPSYLAFVPLGSGALGSPLKSVGAPVSAGDVIFEAAPAATGVTFLSGGDSSSLTKLEGQPLTLAFDDLEITMSSLNPTAEEITAIHERLREAIAQGDGQDGPGDPRVAEIYDGGLLRLAEPVVRGVVPGTAVHLTANGGQCLFRQVGAGWTALPLAELEPAAGTPGAVYVDAALIDAQIARDPLILPASVLSECR